VGSQPFGGEGLSGTGPKAGGPLYLPRLQRPGPAPDATAGPDGPTIPADRLAAAFAKAPLPPASRAERLARLDTALAGLAAATMQMAAAFPEGPFDLPGPTGESNRLSLCPRGRVLLLGAGPEAVTAQAVLALAAGNAVLAVSDGAAAALSRLPLGILDGRIDPAALTDLPDLDLVAAEGPEEWLRALRIALARRDGPIVPLVTDRDPARYVLERHLCIDTTAAGGNASLLAASA